MRRQIDRFRIGPGQVTDFELQFIAAQRAQKPRDVRLHIDKSYASVARIFGNETLDIVQALPCQRRAMRIEIRQSALEPGNKSRFIGQLKNACCRLADLVRQFGIRDRHHPRPLQDQILLSAR